MRCCCFKIVEEVEVLFRAQTVFGRHLLLQFSRVKLIFLSLQVLSGNSWIILVLIKWLGENRRNAFGLLPHEVDVFSHTNLWNFYFATFFILTKYVDSLWLD